MVAKAVFDTIRTLGFAAISGTYANLGTALTKQARAVCITNNTDGDLMISDDGGTTDKLFVAAGAFKLFDVQANINPKFDDKYVLPIGTQFAVKEITNPTAGNIYVEILY